MFDQFTLGIEEEFRLLIPSLANCVPTCLSSSRKAR